MKSADSALSNAGTEPVDVLGWNWSVEESDSKRVTGDIISHYGPSLDGPKLVGGQTVRGFVTFTTGVTATSLTLAGAPFGADLATWNIAAAKPSVVAGAVGVPAQAEISRPPFDVTISTPRSIEGHDPLARQIPGSQHFLLVDAEFTPNEGTAGSLGLIERESFVFVPDGAPAMYSTFGAVAGALSILSLDGSRTDSAVLAFDTSATSGSLELRDGADQAVLAWPIDLG